ncbi:substrate-binding domain-containing protein [Microbacterium sp. C23T]
MSRQTEFTKAATQDWDNAKAQARMDSLPSGFYSNTEIDGVLSPNDGIARAILTSVGNTLKELPVITGLDAENESVLSIWDGQQYFTVYQPTDNLVAKTVEIIKTLQATGKLPEPDRTEINGAADVPVFHLDPEIVTIANMEEVFANDPTRLTLIGG